MGRTGATAIIDALLEHGVEYIFGVPGAAVITLYDELYDAPITTVLNRHEQGAGHMADGYARATGRPGVCLATSGPGATNLVTALATAHMDSVPVIALTGQVKTHLIGNDAFQEADITGMTRLATKHNYLVKDAGDLDRVMREAFHIATTGRPGPVLIDLPADVIGGEAGADAHTALDLPGYSPSVNGHTRQLRKAAAAINAAQRPVLYVGGGILSSNSSGQLREVARKGRIPVTTTLMGLGAFPETEELSLGMLGMHGTAYANYAVTDCDLLIAVGARFDDRITGKIEGFAPKARIIHFDIDPTSIGKNVRADIPVVGDAGELLAELCGMIEPADRREWLDRIAGWKRDFPLSYGNQNGVVKPQAVIEEIYRISAGEAIVTTDVGQHQMWAAHHYQYTEPRTFLTSGGLGTMGYGLPAAMGAQFGRPGSTVFLITGDGSFQMNTQEMATAVHHGLPIKIALLNNGYLGMVRQWQELFYDRRYSGTHLEGNPDFVRLAEAYGAAALAVDRPDEVRPALEESMTINDRPVLIDFHTAPEENVFPMVPAGEAIHRMLSGMA
jgi:acetolactate synthase-1/2/3 large subunit